MTEPAAALVFAEPSGVVRIWNSAAKSLFGHRAVEAIGQTLDLIIPPDYRERHWAGFQAAMAAGDGNIDHSSFNIPALHRDGPVFESRSGCSWSTTAETEWPAPWPSSCRPTTARRH